MSSVEFSTLIYDMRSAVERVLSKYDGDERAELLKQALLSQVSTVKFHYELMCAETDSPLLLTEAEFDELMRPYLDLNREIRRNVIKAPKSLYETTPINAVYKLVSHHFRESGEG